MCKQKHFFSIIFLFLIFWILTIQTSMAREWFGPTDQVVDPSFSYSDFKGKIDLGALSSELSKVDECKKLFNQTSDNLDSLSNKNFADVCMASYQNLPIVFKDKLKSSIGVLANKTNDKINPFCTAFRVNKDTLITARHCITLKDEQTPFDQERTKFYLYGQPDNGFTITNIIENEFYQNKDNRAYNPTTDFYDYVYLKIDGTDLVDNTSFSPIDKIMHANIYDRLIIIGFNTNTSIYNRDESPSYKNSWIENMKWDDSPLCRVIRLEGKCMFYTCQTSQAMSGSPVFAYSNDPLKFSFLGIHTGGFQSNGSNSCTMPSGLYSSPNKGIVPNLIQ